MPSTLFLSVLALALVAVPFSASRAADDEDDDKGPKRTITVNGTGTVSAPPDVAEITVGVVTQAKTAGEALSANTENMASIQQVLKKQGVEPRDIQTTNVNVQPQYSQPTPPRPGQVVEEFVPRIVAYQVTNSVQITARKLDQLGAILDAVVQAGANQIHGISFRVDKPDELMDQARTKAMADARRKADLLASSEKLKVGSPVTINESGGYVPPPRPMMAARMMAAPVPVSAGEEDLTVNVTVVFEMTAEGE
jgi:uncharacterized protein YggE